MNTSVRRTLAATTTVVAALAATLAASPADAVGQAATGTRPDHHADFGFKGTAVGVKLYAGNVQLLTARDAEAPLRCSRRVGRTVESSSVVTAPEDSLISLSGSTSRTVTYHEGDRHGVRATAELGDITLGDTSAGVPSTTPIVTIRGLTSTADAFHGANGYGHQEGITELDLHIDLLPESEVDEPLQDLLDAIDTAALDPVLDVLATAGAPIEIPGLGSIALGRTKHAVNQQRAESDALALEFLITATGETQKLQLGHARARIGGPAPAGVFRSTSMPMAVDVAQGAVRLGHVRPRTIPCEGTAGRVRVKRLPTASVVLPDGMIAGVSDVEYRSMGDQSRNGSARAFQVSRIGSFSIPELDLTIEGITSRVGVSRTKGSPATKSARVSVARIVYRGQEIAVPEPGRQQVIEGLGILRTHVVTDGNRFGQRVVAMRLQLTDYGPTVFDLGIAASRVFPW